MVLPFPPPPTHSADRILSILYLIHTQGESQPRKQKSVLVGIPRRNLQRAFKRSLFRENKVLKAARREVKELEEQIARYQKTIAELEVELAKLEECLARMRRILARHNASS